MLKSILLAGSMMIAAPVLAQTAPATGPMSPTTPPAAATGATSQQTTPQQTTPAQAGPVTDGATAPAQTAQGTDATATPAATPTQSQVAQVVDQQFATYDKDGNGSLSKIEFAAWMTALKADAPAAKPETAAQKTAWNDAAFSQADGDKSATVTKTELTSFLVKGATGAS